jgi:hypothetical protein
MPTLGGAFDGTIEAIQTPQELTAVEVLAGERVNHLFDLTSNNIGMCERIQIKQGADEAFG